MAEKEILVQVIEDDKSVRRAFQLLLSSAGFAVRTFSSGREFLESEGFADKSVIIVDIQMPAMSGLDLIEKLAPREKGLKIIALSADDDLRTRELAGDLGVAAYFRKPVDDQALIDAIEWAMRDKKS